MVVKQYIKYLFLIHFSVNEALHFCLYSTYDIIWSSHCESGLVLSYYSINLK